MSAQARTRALLAIAVIVTAASMWAISQAQRSDSRKVFEQSLLGQRMLTAMLDQETGFRGYALSRDGDFLGPYREGGRALDQAARDALRFAPDTELRRRVAAQTRLASTWRDMADYEIAQIRMTAGRTRSDPRRLAERKEIVDAFRRENAAYRGEVRSSLGRSGRSSVFFILGIALAFGALGYWLIERRARAERRRDEEDAAYHSSQDEFMDTMQIMRGEREAHTMLKRHLERQIPTCEVVVMNRNNSDNRLEATTGVPTESPLAARLAGATPDACLAVRLARPHSRTEGSDPLLECEVCGASARLTTCVPSLVGGEVIGSVLVEHDALGTRDEERIRQSVDGAAPVLANLRNLALAEDRAATDALTGLPNHRAVNETLRRMVAQASRAMTPLSALMLDLDHFKQVNDRFGHAAGDNVLAAVGDVLSNSLRASDFAGRYGGEEFLVLLPDTAHDGALRAAENLRGAISMIEVQSVQRDISASVGVATFPEAALDAEALIRVADRGLYAAKAAGRNRVATAEASSRVDENARVEDGRGVDGALGRA